MPLVRIIGLPDRADDLLKELRDRGFEVETAAKPGALPADLEINLEECALEEAFERIPASANGGNLAVLVYPSVFDIGTKAPENDSAPPCLDQAGAASREHRTPNPQRPWPAGRKQDRKIHSPLGGAQPVKPAPDAGATMNLAAGLSGEWPGKGKPPEMPSRESLTPLDPCTEVFEPTADRSQEPAAAEGGIKEPEPDSHQLLAVFEAVDARQCELGLKAELPPGSQPGASHSEPELTHRLPGFSNWPILVRDHGPDMGVTVAGGRRKDRQGRLAAARRLNIRLAARWLDNERLFTRSAILTAATAILVLLVGAFAHRFAPLPARMLQGSSQALEPAPFKKASPTPATVAPKPAPRSGWGPDSALTTRPAKHE